MPPKPKIVQMKVAPVGGFSMAPRKGFDITPSKGFRVLPVSGPEGLSSNAAVYKTGSGKYALKPKTRAPTARGAVQFVNNYYQQGGLLQIRKVYSSRYSGMKGTARLIPVQTSVGRGWLSTDGRITLEDDLLKLMVSLDATTVGSSGGSQWLLEKYWNTLTPQQRANVADVLLDYDWDDFWREFYPVRGEGGNIDTQYRMYDQIVSLMAQATGREVLASAV